MPAPAQPGGWFLAWRPGGAAAGGALDLPPCYDHRRAGRHAGGYENETTILAIATDGYMEHRCPQELVTARSKNHSASSFFTQCNGDGTERDGGVSRRKISWLKSGAGIFLSCGVSSKSWSEQMAARQSRWHDAMTT